MSLANQVLAVNDDLPIRTHKPVHSGKVRSVYWLTEEDSARLIKEKAFVWIVQKAKPVKIEAICRKYITGSMWRAYANGEREFCGIQLPEGLEKDKALPNLLMTPSTKGILKGIPGVPEADDVNITRQNIVDNYEAFNFSSAEDIAQYEKLLKEGFNVISQALEGIDQIFVDTKFEFGYVHD
ncbi:phosphoribosylaminoimidazolesuccinocarboxamide synthase, partial [Vibrio parahaemolyticus]